MPSSLSQVAAAALLAAGVLGGCGAKSSPDADAPASAIADRCLSKTPAGADLEGITVEADGMSIPAVMVRPSGRPRAAAVLLPQTSSGLCGWLPYAARLAERGVLAVSMDVCAYGDATCPDRLRSQVEVQVDAVLARVGRPALPVTLVGASMGGSQTVRAVARGADVDAWVDVSGPSAWDGDELIDLAPRVTTPGLVVYARSDGALEFRRARHLARATGAQFHEAPHGHGWDLVLRLDGHRPTRTGRVIEEFVLAARTTTG